MIRDKWLKLGAAGFLSLGMLAACGDAGTDTDGENMEENPAEEEDNVDREQEIDNNEPAPEEESDEEAEDDALTDSLDNEEDSESDSEDGN